MLLALSKIATHSSDMTPQFHFDQLAIIARHHHAAWNDIPTINKEESNLDVPHEMTSKYIARDQLEPKFTRKFLQ